MYSVVIDIRKDTPQDVLQALEKVMDQAFDNRVGKVENTSDTPYRFIYRGGEEAYGCLNLGMLNLWDKKDFVACVQSWNWIDEEDPDESCDVIKEMSIPVIL